MPPPDDARGTLDPAEPHPAAFHAKAWLARHLGPHGAGPDTWKLAEAFASCAIDGNRLGEVCAETLRRLMAGEPVSDRYLLGLTWTIRHMLGDVPGPEAAQQEGGGTFRAAGG